MQVALLSPIRQSSFPGAPPRPQAPPLDIFQKTGPPERSFTRRAALALGGGAAGLGAGMLVKYALAGGIPSVAHGVALGTTAGVMLPLVGAMVQLTAFSDCKPVRWDEMLTLTAPAGAAVGAGLGLVGKLAPMAGTTAAAALTLAGLGAGVVAATRLPGANENTPGSPR